MSTIKCPLQGNRFGVDFNPVVDRLRVVSGKNCRVSPFPHFSKDTGANYRIEVASGNCTVDGNLTFAINDSSAASVSSVVAAAYSNNFAGASSTVLYVIDALVRTSGFVSSFIDLDL